MLTLALGGLALLLLLAVLRAFATAPVPTIKSLLSWVAALAGLLLAVLLLLSGRGVIAFGALMLFGPLIWERWKSARPMPGASGPMTRDEALAVLGLQQGASTAEIRAAHRRLMRGAHPDTGGSDWLAARVNQARDTLLGR